MNEREAIQWARITQLQGWFSSVAFARTWRIGRVEIAARMKRADGVMGRFGGGWNWAFGVHVGGSGTVLIYLFVMTLRLSKAKQ